MSWENLLKNTISAYDDYYLPKPRKVLIKSLIEDISYLIKEEKHKSYEEGWKAQEKAMLMVEQILIDQSNKKESNDC